MLCCGTTCSRVACSHKPQLDPPFLQFRKVASGCSRAPRFKHPRAAAAGVLAAGAISCLNCKEHDAGTRSANSEVGAVGAAQPPTVP